MAEATPGGDHDRSRDGDAGRTFVHAARPIGLAWLALLALMLASLGSAYLRLGVFNLAAGLAIAAVKASIVAWLYMRLREAGVLLRLAALAGLGVYAIQWTLTGVDYETRVQTPVAVQRPQQLADVPRARAPDPAASLAPPAPPPAYAR
jgi:cytochrome c oxidase subunit 4